MATMRCPDCNGQVSPSAEACPHCGRPTAHLRKPLLTKPAGVFMPILGLVVLMMGFVIAEGPSLGLSFLLIAGGLIWFGRQTRPRPPK